ncbi:DUF4124 domain-containing protein [Aliamphritea spongicola]|uniref:DUF4124 domain-containing protein n=1 Tax=Aliamphritea spongicola TaxID=707589 RepID=UPI00196A7A1B|nr:DUF4124 domain-containing protein [Aliamphritea spongicola]MBN3561810.1 DUF4124 domain-containing protein [Aliamphritea spongicola]
MMLKQIITITALCTFSLFVQAGKIYKCQDQSGKKSFQSTPCRGEKVTLKSDKIIVRDETGATSSSVTRESLQGRWLITHLGKTSSAELDVGEDIWEFSQNQWTVISNGHRLRPEKFTVADNMIKFSTYSVTILEFDGTRMKVDAFGTIQRLKKQ